LELLNLSDFLHGLMALCFMAVIGGLVLLVLLAIEYGTTNLLSIKTIAAHHGNQAKVYLLQRIWLSYTLSSSLVSVVASYWLLDIVVRQYIAQRTTEIITDEINVSFISTPEPHLYHGIMHSIWIGWLEFFVVASVGYGLYLVRKGFQKTASTWASQVDINQ
jgi:hypothetical protein